MFLFSFLWAGRLFGKPPGATTRPDSRLALYLFFCLPEVIVKALAEKGAAIDFKDYQDRTPLHEVLYGLLGR